MSSAILVLFTASYPYIVGGEQNFLEMELQHLLPSFKRVVLVPEQSNGSRLNELPLTEVDGSYSSHLGSYGILHTFLRGLLSPLFYRGLMEKPVLFFSFSALRRLFSFAGKAEITRQWVTKWLRAQDLDGKDCLFYTYWFDQAAAGISLARQSFPGLRLISRAHGYDVYEEQYYNPPFWPCRKWVLSVIDRVYPDSKAAVAYLRRKYPDFSSKYEASLLGVRDPGFITMPSQDGVFRIISCSMIRPVKRVDRLLKAIRHAAVLRPDQKIDWHHFGTGDMLNALQKTADETFSSNARAYFHGYSDNPALMRFYRENPLDVFVNLSESEGTPVSVMEAISCGISVIATAVGGNTEIVSEQNGLLLSPDPLVDEVASAFFYFMDNPTEAEKKRNASREVWQSQYNADRNFSIFAQKLISVRSE